jgi:hypothetical protein
VECDPCFLGPESSALGPVANSGEQRAECSGSVVANGLVFDQRSKEQILNKDLCNCVRYIRTKTNMQGMSMFSFAFCVSIEVKEKTVAFAGCFTRLSLIWTVRRRIVEQGCTDFSGSRRTASKF